jgi:hypothetical protein
VDLAMEWRTLHDEKLSWTEHVAQISRGKEEMSTAFQQQNLLRSRYLRK